MTYSEKQILAVQSRRLSSVKVTEEKEAERKIYDLTTSATKVLMHLSRKLSNVKESYNKLKNKALRYNQTLIKKVCDELI